MVELLSIIAIITILASIIIGGAGVAQNAMYKAQTKSMFAAWMNALEQYKQEYGYYPPGLFNSSGVLDLTSGTKADDFRTALDGTTDATLNRKGIPFYQFSESEQNEAGDLADAFGNTFVYICVDHDNDGDFRVSGADEAIDADIIAYSSETADGPGVVFSWK